MGRRPAGSRDNVRDGSVCMGRLLLPVRILPARYSSLVHLTGSRSAGSRNDLRNYHVSWGGVLLPQRCVLFDVARQLYRPWGHAAGPRHAVLSEYMPAAAERGVLSPVGNVHCQNSLRVLFLLWRHTAGPRLHL